MKMPRDLLACALWVAAIVTFGFGMDDSIREGHNSLAIAASLFIADMALVPTGAWILDHYAEKHRASVEDVAAMVEAMRRQEDGPPRPRSIR